MKPFHGCTIGSLPTSKQRKKAEMNQPRQANLMTPEKCAEFLGIKINTLYVMKSQGRIPYRKVGHLLRFDLAEIIAWTKGQLTNH
jgi:excisionase family DNA binding protein